MSATRGGAEAPVGHRGHAARPLIENPIDKLSDEQIKELGELFDQLHEEVKNDLGERDATYIRSIIELQRRLAVLGRILVAGSKYRPPAGHGRRRAGDRPRSSRTWRSATTSCTASGTG